MEPNEVVARMKRILASRPCSGEPLGDVFTTVEVANAARVARPTATDWIREGIQLKTLEYAGMVPRARMNGVMAAVPAYRFIEKKADRARAKTRKGER